MGNAEQTSNLIEPRKYQRRRITAIAVIIIVVVSLLFAIITEPYSSETKGQGDISGGLIWIGQIIISFIALLTAITELIGINIRELFISRSAKTSVEEFPFHVFQDFDSVLDYLFPDPQKPLIADRSIPYLPQISEATDNVFQKSGLLLIRGRSKTGKTREAIELLRRWWYTGPTVLVARNHIGLHPPFKIPDNLPTRNLILFFDDIDRYMGDSASLKRLDETIEFFESICHGHGELRVIATVRQEDEFWTKLDYDEKSTPWNKFELIQLAPLSAEKAQTVIAELANISGIEIETSLQNTLAKKNDGTFLNLALTFRHWLNQDITCVTEEHIQSFEGALLTTWRKRYEQLVETHPELDPVFAAIDFLQTNDIPLRPDLIHEIATEMSFSKRALSFLGMFSRLKYWGDMTPLLNWYRDPKHRRRGFWLIASLGLILLYLSLYAFLRFTPGNTQTKFFEEIVDNLGLQVKMLIPLWSLLIPFIIYSISNLLNNNAYRKSGKALNFLLSTEVPMRESELRPYEGQFEGNGSSNNWSKNIYASIENEKNFTKKAAQRITSRYLILAEKLRLDGEYTAAFKMAELAKSLTPRNPTLYIVQGNVKLDEGNYQKALELFESAKILFHHSSNRANVEERVALNYFYQTNYAKAAQIAEQALRKIPSLIMARWILGLSQLKNENKGGEKNCKIASGSGQPIPTELQRAVYKIGIDPAAWHKETMKLLTNDSQIPKKKDISLFIGKKPDRGKFSGLISLSIVLISILFISIIYIINSKYQHRAFSTNFTQTLIKIFPNSPTLLALDCEFLHESGEYEKALAVCNEAVLIDPEYAVAYNNRGTTYSEYGEYERAIAEFTEAIRFDPEYVRAIANRGNVYNRGLLDYQRGIADCTEAIRINPEYAFAYGERAYSYYQLDEFEFAIRDLSEAIRVDPEYKYGYQLRSTIYYRIGEHELAEADFQKYQELTGNP